MQPITKLLLPIILLCVLYATTGSARALDEPAVPDATALAPIDDDASANLVCHGQLCAAGEQCCSCKPTPTSPLVFFCHTPDNCPHGGICRILP